MNKQNKKLINLILHMYSAYKIIVQETITSYEFTNF